VAKAVVIDLRDNVAVVLEEVRRGDPVVVEAGEERLRLSALSDIPFGHKIAVKRIPRGGEVVKYGEVIGRATRDIEPGEHVHVHNVESVRGKGARRGFKSRP